MLTTAITQLLGIRHPVFQGGMAWVGTAELSAAVSEAGGLGILGAGSRPADWVRDQIRQVRQRTGKPFGVNVLLISPHAADIVQVVIDENVPVVTTGAGSPGPYLPALKARGIKVLPVVASVALAKRLERMGADGFVAEGMESGGHIGEVTTLALVPQVVDAVRVPVVAAGGIADGRGLAAALALGAHGVQMGTRFVASAECIAHQAYKDKIVAARERSTVATGYRLGHPVRALENRFTRQFADMEERHEITEADLMEFGTGRMRLGSIEGDVENGSLMCGQIAGLISDVKTCRQIIEETVAQAEAIIAGLGRFVAGSE
jgi:enoyl-[acyl-carrier protein] reductase II